MSGTLALVEEVAPIVESEAAAVPQGRLAKVVYKVRQLKRKIGAVEQFSLLAQLRGLGSLAWLVGFVGSILILNRFVSPIITELAMTTLIAPIAALVLVALGEFDFTRLTTMMTSNVGIVFATGGMIIAALFVQNVVKMALLTKSFTSQSHKQYRTYALASMLTPVTTSALWYLATKLEYFLGAKSISLGILAIFASGVVGETLNNVDPMNATAADLAAVANAMSNGLRWGLGFLVAVHLFFVFKSYGLVHRALNVTFNFVVKKTVDDGWHIKSVNFARAHWFIFGFGLSLAAMLTSAAIDYSEVTPEEQAEVAQEEAERAQQQVRAARYALQVVCVNGATFATEGGRAYRMTNANGTSHCASPTVQRNLRMGEHFSAGKSYRREVIELDAGGYDQVCLDQSDGLSSSREDLNGNCRIDNTARRSVRYWLELPAGLPEGVRMPE